MTIFLSDAGKRFNRDWIFRHLNYQFEAGQSYAITGPNGSGKSTLLQALSGSMYINEGITKWIIGNKEISNEQVYNHVSICAPYLEVVEEMTLREFLDFHQDFKPLLPGVTTDSIISLLGLEKAENKQIRFYSSGMKQRVKLAQCIFSDTAIVLLDEPCTNLDGVGIELYHSLITAYCKNRLVVVSSNDEVEYKFCSKRINISDFKS
ncbi:MAG: ATP-binding cassette domain-containing protein [Chitinophagaceae bacterium]|jgi:ABC-type multidrug transport system ATPase subunit|nr:ATP-binding cassette domain-containing protein [Chitinophagaceae bacterium]MBK7678567.1 ATP-binding cassette domain-containing protein [Chitinophagaceae bacterium]MBK8300087.1 ATP-binding cassette domain-containing protein [Chitinophagaceae bacterium]MBK9464130.1 ATP-binding cassette domain-containing protein [Chitinophagaceae bacterium]MBK9658749.1 ATP-binding cassette domain-containing protein [Chitinophagaceae bacterium]